MSGGDVKASPRCAGQDPRGLKAQEGIEVLVDVKPPSASTDRRSE